MRRVHLPIRQAAAVRQAWIADLNQVYEAIRTSPSEIILERAGDVGMRYEEPFRHALSIVQSVQPPRECEEVHHALVNWLTHLHAACLSLMDARRLKDRSMLGLFRERLGLARRHAQTLALLRNQLVTVYRLRPDAEMAKSPAAVPQAATSSPPPPPVRLRLSRPGPDQLHEPHGRASG